MKFNRELETNAAFTNNDNAENKELNFFDTNDSWEKELDSEDLKVISGGTGGAVSNLLNNTDVSVDASGLPVVNKLPRLVNVNAPVTETATDTVGSLGL